jgi:hypothetical protein
LPLNLGSERTLRVVKEHSDRIVKWNTESIVGAIRDLDKVTVS